MWLCEYEWTCQKTHYNAKITKIEGKIPGISGLPTAVVLNGVENKRPNVSDVVKKTNYDTKIPDIESKYLTVLDNYKFTGEILNAKIKVKWLVNKSDISGVIENSDLDKKIR